MTTPACRLPAALAQDIDDHAHDVDRFLKGDLSGAILKSRRVPRGIYEQRQNGAYMTRVRVPGGIIDTAQARALAAVASRYGSGTLHATTRQDLQIHGVKLEETPAILKELFPAGLTSKGGGGNTVRNVTACPYAGICPAERFDVTPCVAAVTEYLIGLPGSYNLPRKYKIAFSGCGADCALAQVNDLGFIAKVRDGAPGFSVYAGGGMGAESRVGDRIEEWVPATDVVRIAEAIRRLFDRHGDRRNRRRARLRFVLERLGSQAFAGLVREAVQGAAAEGVPAVESLPSVSVPAIPPPGAHRHLLGEDGALMILRQKQSGFVSVFVPLPLGQIRWQELDALAGLADQFTAGRQLRTTQDQALLLPFVREADLKSLRRGLEGVFGIGALRSAPLQSFTACTGAATCRLGLCLSQPAARACADALAQVGFDPVMLRELDIRMNGCPNACGQHPIGTIGLFGATLRVGERLAPAYRVLLGARRAEGRARLGTPAGIVTARALPAFLSDLLSDFQAGRTPGEPFADYFDRRGLGHFQSVLQRHAQTPRYSDDPSFYRDWGSEEDFTLAGRGAGECGAGVFEVIAEDLAVAGKALAQAAQDGDDGDVLFRGLLASVRALLITRGVDSQQPDEILRAFEKHFVDAGFVDAGFRGLLARARGYHEGWREALAGRREETGRLLARVELLYSTMDADLKFHVPETVVAPAAPATAAAEVDLRGVACPMNFVKAKLRLETLEPGATLGVILDEGAPVQNVPASFRNEGQEIVETRDIGGGHWRVVVKKRN